MSEKSPGSQPMGRNYFSQPLGPDASIFYLMQHMTTMTNRVPLANLLENDDIDTELIEYLLFEAKDSGEFKSDREIITHFLSENNQIHLLSRLDDTEGSNLNAFAGWVTKRFGTHPRIYKQKFQSLKQGTKGFRAFYEECEFIYRKAHKIKRPKPLDFDQKMEIGMQFVAGCNDMNTQLHLRAQLAIFYDEVAQVAKPDNLIATAELLKSTFGERLPINGVSLPSTINMQISEAARLDKIEAELKLMREKFNTFIYRETRAVHTVNQDRNEDSCDNSNTRSHGRYYLPGTSNDHNERLSGFHGPNDGHWHDKYQRRREHNRNYSRRKKSVSRQRYPSQDRSISRSNRLSRYYVKQLQEDYTYREEEPVRNEYKYIEHEKIDGPNDEERDTLKRPIEVIEDVLFQSADIVNATIIENASATRSKFYVRYSPGTDSEWSDEDDALLEEIMARSCNDSEFDDMDEFQDHTLTLDLKVYPRRFICQAIYQQYSIAKSQSIQTAIETSKALFCPGAIHFQQEDIAENEQLVKIEENFTNLSQSFPSLSTSKVGRESQVGKVRSAKSGRQSTLFKWLIIRQRIT